MNIGGWLRNLGLERYEPVFIENAIARIALMRRFLSPIGIPSFSKSPSVNTGSTSLSICLPALPLHSRAESRRIRKAGNPAGLLPSAVTSP